MTPPGRQLILQRQQPPCRERTLEPQTSFRPACSALVPRTEVSPPRNGSERRRLQILSGLQLSPCSERLCSWRALLPALPPAAWIPCISPVRRAALFHSGNVLQDLWRELSR